MYAFMSRSLINSGKTLYSAHACNCKTVNRVNTLKRRLISHSRQKFTNEKTTNNEELEKGDEHNLPSGLADKFKVFHDQDAPVIFDVTEEKKRIELGELNVEEEEIDPYEGINLQRGVNGVFEIQDVIEALKRDNARQIFVATCPKEYSYVDYVVIVSGRSPRHMLAMATFVRKLFKLKRHPNDIIPKIEGKSSTDWMALDLGNIALHIFSHQARQKYDLETLWAVGSQYDDLSNVKDAELDIMEKYRAFLDDLQPAE